MSLKTDISSQPSRIIARFMICYTARLIYRIPKKKFDTYDTHFTIENIIGTLHNMNVANIDELCYMSTYSVFDICTASMSASKKCYQTKDLNKKQILSKNANIQHFTGNHLYTFLQLLKIGCFGTFFHTKNA